MDIKLKNNHKRKIMIPAAGLLLITILNLFFFPVINRNAQQKLGEQKQQTLGYSDTELLRALYKGCYVMNLEVAVKQGENPITAYDLYAKETAKDLESDDIQDLADDVNSVLDMWSSNFEEWRSMVDYCVIFADGGFEKNTENELELVINNTGDKEKISKLKEYYSDYFVLRFDEMGNLEIQPLYSRKAYADTLIKAFQQIDREKLLANGLYYDENIVLKGPVNFQVIFGIPEVVREQVSLNRSASSGYIDYWTRQSAYKSAGAGAVFGISLLLIAVLVLIMNSKKIWKTDIIFTRPGNWYLMEAALVGVISAGAMQNSFIQLFWYNDDQSFLEFLQKITADNAYYGFSRIGETMLCIFMIYAVWYLSLHFIRPVFSLGIKEYIRQYSFLYQIKPWIKKKWKRFTNEVGHIDFGEKSTKTILKLLALNLLILSLISSMWFFGIGVLLVYSSILFFLIKKYYNKAGKNYRQLLHGVNQIAEGNLDVEIVEDLGIFEPFKEELAKIQSGFKLAVEEEVKSQRLKTELITNVSHDLKTPLTSITTYVELLKKENITEEERRSYIETLEKKSLRLKVLIEDLFEVSKAASKNITLNRMEMDVINLMKQVSIEHAGQFEAAGLKLFWSVPQEKTLLMLDNQKTYRIFENLFVNVHKYAMPGSRVYIDAQKEGEVLEIILKNMSQAPLNFKEEEITERFVRGDISRNTEGSGLGLAIAKSFTEIQGGTFRVEVDGDLFKVVIRWKCDIIYP